MTWYQCTMPPSTELKREKNTVNGLGCPVAPQRGVRKKAAFIKLSKNIRFRADADDVFQRIKFRYWFTHHNNSQIQVPWYFAHLYWDNTISTSKLFVLGRRWTKITGIIDMIHSERLVVIWMSVNSTWYYIPTWRYFFSSLLCTQKQLTKIEYDMMMKQGS